MLTQLTTLKARLDLAESDVQDDALLTRFIVAVSGRFERQCNRLFGRGDDATYEFRADARAILPERYPVESISKWELKDDETTGWVTQTDIVYLFGPGQVVIELAVALGTSAQIGRITYDGGYVLPGGTVSTGQTALPDELENACVEQVVYLFQNRNRLGLAGVSGQGGSLQKDLMSVVTPAVFLPDVMSVLKKYERWEC